MRAKIIFFKYLTIILTKSGNTSSCSNQWYQVAYSGREFIVVICLCHLNSVKISFPQPNLLPSQCHVSENESKHYTCKIMIVRSKNLICDIFRHRWYSLCNTRMSILLKESDYLWHQCKMVVCVRDWSL